MTYCKNTLIIIEKRNVDVNLSLKEEVTSSLAFILA